MSARDELRKYVNLLADSWTPPQTTADRVEWLYEQVRAEVRREAANDIHRADLPTFAAGETPENVAKVVRAVDVRLAERGSTAPYGRTKDEARSAEPNFFQTGRTYLYPATCWKFRCDAITTNPNTGQRVALGWSQFRRNEPWQTQDMSEAIWSEGAFQDITEAQEQP